MMALSSGVFNRFLVGQMVGLSDMSGQETSASRSREQQRANSQPTPTPTHAGGDHKLSAAAAFGMPIPNFGGGGAIGAAQDSRLKNHCRC